MTREQFEHAIRAADAVLRVSELLFVDRFQRGLGRTNWSVFPDGKEFLMISRSENMSSPKAVVNWPQLPARKRGGGAAR